MYCVYILEYVAPTVVSGAYYVGHTHNGFHRITSHCLGTGAQRTKHHGVRRIVGQFMCQSRQDARRVMQRVERIVASGITLPEQECSFLSPASLLYLAEYLGCWALRPA